MPKRKVNMSPPCTIKEAFIATKLDEYQPSWRNGADVVLETKLKIEAYIQEHYKDLLSTMGAKCLTHMSIEETTKRARKKLGIQAKRHPTKLEDKPISWTNNNRVFQDDPEPEKIDCGCEQSKDIDSGHDPIESVQFIDDGKYALINTRELPELKPERQEPRAIIIVPFSCNHPYCDQFAMITQEDQLYCLITSPLRYGKFIRPYCSTACRDRHKELLRDERIKSMAN